MINIISMLNSSMRELNRQEQMKLKPFDKAELSQIKFLGHEYLLLESSENLCLENQCQIKAKEVEVYLSKPKKYLENLVTEELTQEICILPKYQCFDTYSFEIMYNCIGFAIGVMKWIKSGLIKGNSPSEAITNFIATQNIGFPSDYAWNFFGILENIQYVQNVSYPYKNNTIAFYFIGNECKHAARYIIDFDLWVSKLGGSILIGHSLEDLMGEVYGEEIHFAEIVGYTTDYCID